MLQYGHGLLGRKAEAHNSYLREMANRYNFIIVATDMQGMNTDDGIIWAIKLGRDISDLPDLQDKIHQGINNHLAIMRMVKGRLWEDAAFQVNGKSIIDTKRLYYYGNSQGGTMGNIMMSLQKDVTRGVLGVPGGAFAFLLNRSIDFKPFSDVIKGVYPDTLDFIAIFGIMQMGFNLIEPVNYLPKMTENRFPNTPKHHVLLHVAKEDAQVQNDVSFFMGRVLGAKLMTPAVRDVWGLDKIPYPYKGNALVEFDFKKPDNPKATFPPPKKHDTHSHLRKDKIGQEQLWHFLETGEVKNFCDGACDPH